MLRNITCTDDSADLPFIANELLQLRLREIAFAQTRAAHNHRIFKIQHPRTVRHSLNFCGDLHAVHYFRRRRILVKMCDDEAVTPRLGTFRHCNVHVPLQLQGGRVTVRTGGEEAALFAGDLLRMYMRYAEKRGWAVTLQSENTTELGGVKDVQLAIRAKGTPAPEDGVWASLKYEGGVHRVQRIPVTESQGRIQTSAAGVIVFPEADEDDDEIDIDPKDLKIDIFMSSGPGGQSVNTTYSAVRMTHIPTGIVVSMQDEKSQIQNRASALRVLKSRLLAMKHEEEAAQAADMRHSQVRSLDRSERIRTYNFPENRIVDHRTNYKAYNLDAVLDGDLQAVIDSDIQADEADRLANQK